MYLFPPAPPLSGREPDKGEAPGYPLIASVSQNRRAALLLDGNKSEMYDEGRDNPITHPPARNDAYRLAGGGTYYFLLYRAILVIPPPNPTHPSTRNPGVFVVRVHRAAGRTFSIHERLAGRPAGR